MGYVKIRVELLDLLHSFLYVFFFARDTSFVPVVREKRLWYADAFVFLKPDEEVLFGEIEVFPVGAELCNETFFDENSASYTAEHILC